MNELSEEYLPYMVGGLLYTPAMNTGIAEKIKKRCFKCLTSIAFCLEDSIADNALTIAEEKLKETFSQLEEIPIKDLPLIFIRIRTPEHMEHIHEFIGDYKNIITGYILPKFDMSNAEKYSTLIKNINTHQSKKIYVMPILESSAIADTLNRKTSLSDLKRTLNQIKEFILNVRVGGNDFSQLYGLRRKDTQNIYQMGVIRDILIDIINVFGIDYVVSGAVWEYFKNSSSNQWATGLKAELELDRLNGFIGKTAIHPSQLPLIFESLKVSSEDFNDAVQLLGWSDKLLGVTKSLSGSRMNEVKCHTKWAKRIYILGKIYGIKEA